MKNIRLIKALVIFTIAIFTFAFSVLFAHPSNATIPSNQRIIKLGSIEAIKSPNELGIEYLPTTSPQLTASLMDAIGEARGIVQNTTSLMDAIGEARGIVQNTTNIQVKIPMTSPDNAPISNRVLPTTDWETDRFQSLAFVNWSSGELEPITPNTLDAIFAIGEERGGRLNHCAFGAIPKETLVADASGSFLNAQARYFFNLIAQDTHTGEIVLLRNVEGDAFLRDALNAVLVNEWESNDIDLSRIRL